MRDFANASTRPWKRHLRLALALVDMNGTASAQMLPWLIEQGYAEASGDKTRLTAVGSRRLAELVEERA